MDIRRQIAAAAGSPVIDIAPLGGGCVSAVYEARLGDGRRVVAKVDESGSDTPATEAFMLRYLAERTALPVPAVVAVDGGVLLMEYVEGDSRFDGAAEEDAAERLAALHALTAPTFGFERNTLIGGLRQPNRPTPGWLDFFAEQRLSYMAGEAARAGRLPAATRARVERLAGHLDRWLMEPAAPSLIHGDVWTTNVLARGGRITAFLDPAITFADATRSSIATYSSGCPPILKRWRLCKRSIAPAASGKSWSWFYASSSSRWSRRCHRESVCRWRSIWRKCSGSTWKIRVRRQRCWKKCRPRRRSSICGFTVTCAVCTKSWATCVRRCRVKNASCC